MIRRLSQEDLGSLRRLFENYKGGKFSVYRTATPDVVQLLFNDFKNYYEKNRKDVFLYKGEKGKGIVALRKLDWDTDIFGFNCSSLDYLIFEDPSHEEAFDSLTEQANDWARDNAIKFMVAKFHPSEKKLIEMTERQCFKKIEELVTLRNYLNNLQEEETNVRKFKKEETDAIGKISQSSFTHTRFMKDTNFEKEKARELKYRWAVNCCNGRADDVLVAEVSGDLAGFITCNADEIPGTDTRYGDIQLIAVSENYRGKGIGDKLVKSALRWFREKNCEFVDVSTQSDNSPAIKLYEKNGFQHSHSQITMHKWLL
ncbi:GNAT family N-acetyltransferase [Candidatus Pacearchaeota archaeon]|nr:GNAT family N-acetyltransferase [Candidatus Pacearchaeota archaeon]